MSNIQTNVVSTFGVGLVGLAVFSIRRHFKKIDDEAARKLREELDVQKPPGQSGFTCQANKPTMGKGDVFDSLRKKDIPDLQDLRLLGEIYAGDICVFTGPTNMGKSIIAMQAAIDIAYGRPSSLFPHLPVCGMPTDVLIYDAEQRLEQIKNRYFSNEKVSYPSNITRYPSCDDDNAANLETVYNTFEKAVQEATKNIAGFIDNLTILIKNNTPAQVSEFLDRIKGLRNQMRAKGLYLTMIIVTHTNDKYTKEDIKPIKESNIYGSSFLSDFADSIIGIHRSEEADTTDEHPYIQIIKKRAVCLYDGFKTKRVSRPYAMLKYDDNIPAKLLNGGKKPQRNIDFSPDGVEFMYYNLYLECRMSPREICKLYGCSPSQINKLFKRHYGKDFKSLFPRGEHNPEKGKEYYQNRRELIRQIPPEYEGEKVKG
jgi:archaellum biogenesis ATPase FlaH